MLATRSAPRLPRIVPFPEYTSVKRERGLHAHLRQRVLYAMQITNTKQAEICRKAGVPRATLSQQLQTGRFDIEVLYKVAKVLNRPIGWFFPEEQMDGIPAEKTSEVIQRIEQALEWGRRGGKKTARRA